MSRSAMTRRCLGAGSALAAALAAGAMLMLSGQASADPPSGDSGDPRATAYPGNVKTCDGASLSGSKVDVTSTEDDTYIDITAVPDDVTISGVVVKGGPGYNIYLPGSLGALPWTGLHAPLVPSDKPGGISHWFACGTTSTTTTTTKTPCETTTTTEETTTTTSATETTTTDDTTSSTSTSGTTSGTTSSAPSTGVTTTTGGAVVTTSLTGGDTTPQGGLAYTGFARGWLVPAGVALLAVGATLLFLVRRRATADRRG